MYSQGDTIYLFSDNLSSTDLSDVSPASAHAFFSSLTRPSNTQKPAHLKPERPLIYQMRILHAYTPFTMSSVCRVRLSGVFESPAALAPFVPLPTDTSDANSLDLVSPPATVQPSSQCSTEYILKLYDHRCFLNVREQCDQGRPYSVEKALAYHKYHNGPPTPYFSHFFNEMPGCRQRPWTEYDVGLFEAWMEVDARRTFEREVAVYNVLADLQGSVIPRIFDTVSTNTPFTFQPAPSVMNGRKEHAMEAEEGTQLESNIDSSLPIQEDPLIGTDLTRLAAGHRVHGILMEYVPGVSLREFIGSCLRSRQELREQVASIASEAVALVLKIGSYPVLNRDIRLDNMLVRQSYVTTLALDDPNLATNGANLIEGDPRASTELCPSQKHDAMPTTTARCVAIDFGQTRLRFDDETDEQWRCAKFFDDEEDAMADALSWEMQQVFKQLLDSGVSTEDNDGENALQKVCQEEQAALWRYEAVRPWYRELSPEEESEYESDLRWGQHPGNWV